MKFCYKKYRKAEYVQRRVPSSNVKVLFVFEVVLIVVFHRRFVSSSWATPMTSDRLQRRPLVPKKSVDEQIFNLSQSTSLTFIICLFELGDPSDLNGDINRRDHFRPGPRQ